jgi:hypothetical protein
MNTVIRRVALAVLSLCLAASLAAGSYHPNILESQVVTLDARSIEVYANNSKPFDLLLGKTKVTVVLAPAPLWPEKGMTIYQVGAEGKVSERVYQGNITYAGDVVGEDPAESEVRFTIARGILQGYVLTSTGWWFIEPLVRFDPKAAANQYLVYAAHDTDLALDFGDDDAVKADPVDWNPVPISTPIPLVWVFDVEYADQSGPAFEFVETWAALLNAVNGIFFNQFGRDFTSPHGVGDIGGRILTSSNPAVLLNQVVGLVDDAGGLEALGADIAHLTTGKELAGAGLGASWRPGRYAASQQSATLDFRNLIITAHQIGHNYNAGHEQADRWCEPPCDEYVQTLCWKYFDNNTLRRFSNGTYRPDHNNADLMCTEMANRGFPCVLQP